MYFGGSIGQKVHEAVTSSFPPAVRLLLPGSKDHSTSSYMARSLMVDSSSQPPLGRPPYSWRLDNVYHRCYSPGLGGSLLGQSSSVLLARFDTKAVHITRIEHGLSSPKIFCSSVSRTPDKDPCGQ